MGAGRFIGLVLASIAVLGLCGCGGGSGTSSESISASSAPSRKAYIANANKICKRASAERAEAVERLLINISKESANPSPAEEQVRVGREAVLPREEEMVDELRALEPPSGDEAEIGKLIELYEKGISELKADPRSAFTTISKSGVDEMAQSYGLSEYCSI